MRISEMSSRSQVPVATIKYYLREGLLPEGRRSAPTQALYGEEHLSRLRLVRALIESGVSVAESRKVLAALDDPPEAAHDLLGAAHAAIARPSAGPIDTAQAEELVARLGGEPGMCDARVLGGVAQALAGLDRAGFTVADDLMEAYLDAVQRIARAEIAGVPTDSAEAAVRYVVLGTVLVEPLLLALRRVAEQIASAERFGGDPGPAAS